MKKEYISPEIEILQPQRSYCASSAVSSITKDWGAIDADSTGSQYTDSEAREDEF